VLIPRLQSALCCDVLSRFGASPWMLDFVADCLLINLIQYWSTMFMRYSVALLNMVENKTGKLILYTLYCWSDIESILPDVHGQLALPYHIDFRMLKSPFHATRQESAYRDDIQNVRVF
jgi:hypothetical protein